MALIVIILFQYFWQPPEAWSGGGGHVSKEMIQNHCPPPAPDIRVIFFFNYLYFLLHIREKKRIMAFFIFIYSKIMSLGWKEFSNWATTIKYSSNYRYWGAAHRVWTRPWQLILMHLGTHPPCNLSSNGSLRISVYVFSLAFSYHQEDLQCNLAPTRVCHLLIATYLRICQRKPILVLDFFVKLELLVSMFC